MRLLPATAVVRNESQTSLLTRLLQQKACRLTSLNEMIVCVEGLDICYHRGGMGCR